MSRVGVVVFPGSLDDRDASRAIRLAGAEPIPLWHASSDLDNTDALVIPGGFSYGDYLRAGALASHAPIMREVVAAADRGMPILGICNGFQILTEARLLEGALQRNEGGTFVCRDQRLRVDSTESDWTSDYTTGETVTLPIKHADGRYVADDHTVHVLEDEGRILFRYVDDNPNGSRDGIAGITNLRGNVVGLMPHPEYAVEPGFGPTTSAAMASGTDGLRMFTGLIRRILTT